MESRGAGGSTVHTILHISCQVSSTGEMVQTAWKKLRFNG